MICATCRAAVAAAAPVGPGVDDSVALGMTFFGLREDAALCPECLQEVSLAGAAVRDAGRRGLCPRCRTEGPA